MAIIAHYRAEREHETVNRQDAITEIRANWETILRGITPTARQNVNGKTSYVCPICGHGSHGDGLTINPQSRKRGALKCFGCDFSGDVIDLLQQVNNCDFNAALETAAAELGITIDPYRPDAAADFAEIDRAQGTQRPDRGKDGETATDTAKPPQQATGTATREEMADYTAYYMQCAERLRDPAALSYLQARGISSGVARRFRIGYDPEWISPTAVKRLRDKGNDWTPPATARIIMPVTKNHYVARATDPDTEPQYKKQNETGGGEAGIFNAAGLYNGAPETVFVVEGIFDALSIIEAGGVAVALNSTSNAARLVKQLETRPTDATLILCLDDDKAGKRAADTLRDGLTRLNISFILSDINCGQNDPNDALRANRGEFVKAIREAERQAGTKPDNVAFYVNNLMGTDIERFKSDIKTGFRELDRLSGGLYPGLYCIGAISSLGKTTFTHQMADQIAAAGNDVLFFSMEQSRLEMVSKSIARINAQKDLNNVITSLSIRKGYLPQAIREAAREYVERVGDRLSIIEGNFNCDLLYISEYIRRYIRQNGTRPVVVIDYLQILQPTEDGSHRQTTKEVIDAAVIELKRISREFGITVIIISSMNRANYLTPVDFESFKESGAIEYTCDVIIGLQLRCINDSMFGDAKTSLTDKRERVRREKAATPRKIELVCLKNRYGVSSFCCEYNYYPAADLFLEDAGDDFITRETVEKSIEQHRRLTTGTRL